MTADTFALKSCRLIQRIRDGDQMLTLVIAVIRILARAILKALDLGEGVPPQVLGFVGSVDDGVRQAVVAVEVFGFVAQRVNLGDEVAYLPVPKIIGGLSPHWH